jgi:hypothetical protein
MTIEINNDNDYLIINDSMIAFNDEEYIKNIIEFIIKSDEHFIFYYGKQNLRLLKYTPDILNTFDIHSMEFREAILNIMEFVLSNIPIIIK